MSPPPLHTANPQLLIEHTHRCRNDFPVAGPPPQLFALPYQGFVGKRSDEFAVFLRIKFLQSDGAEHGSTPEWNVEAGTKILARRLRYHW
jgi:hypothetical protein